MTRKYPKNTEIHELSQSEKNAAEHQYEIDHQMVKGKFVNYQQKNNPIRFPYRIYLKDPIEWYPKNVNGKPDYFMDGRSYEIPLMVANHLNERCAREIHQHANDENGKPLPETMIGKKIHRFGFINTDFRPIQGWKEQPQLVTVTSTKM